MEQKKSGERSRRNQYRRELPPIGTKLKATYRGKEYIAEIVSSSTDPDRRAILF
ncbi:unnamed protein product, partial [marine sediment metagenome]